MSGGYGRDRMYGGSGNDVMRGDHHGDKMFGGPGVDVIDSGPGGDFVSVAGDAKRDSVSCGIAKDTVVIDRADLVRESFEDFVRRSSCENVIVR
jgi:Ca2+-binding RTX toxin-like protein